MYIKMDIDEAKGIVSQDKDGKFNGPDWRVQLARSIVWRNGWDNAAKIALAKCQKVEKAGGPKSFGSALLFAYHCSIVRKWKPSKASKYILGFKLGNVEVDCGDAAPVLN